SPSSNGTAASGVKNYDVYVATDGGAFAFWKTVTASTGATTNTVFTAASSHVYGFRSVARDKAGNVEGKPPDLIEATATVPDLSGPKLQVPSVVCSASTFTVSMQGVDIGSSGIASFDLYVSTDGAAAKKVATLPAGTAGPGGVYSVQTQYAALVDGKSH